MTKELKFIIQEEQDNLRETLIFYIESNFGFSHVRVRNSDEAYEILKDELDIVLILSGSGEGLGDGRNLINLNKKYFANRNIICRNIRPLVIEKIPNEQSIDLVILKEELLEKFTQSEEVKSKDFTPVAISSLPYFNGINHNLYIKLPSGRYVMLFRKDDVVDWSDTFKYRERGVTHLYLKQDCFFWVLKTLENNISQLRDNPEGSVNVNVERMNELHRIDDTQVMEVLASSVNIRKLAITKTDSKQIFSLINTLEWDDNPMKKRAELIALLACGMAKELSWGSEDTYNKLTLASMYHDILLWQNPLLVTISTESEFLAVRESFTAEEYILFKSHPEITAKYCETQSWIPDEVGAIIAQHHERPSGDGFPHKLKHGRIRAFSAVLIISIDLADYILTVDKWSILSFVESRQERYSGPVFRKTLNAVKAIGTLVIGNKVIMKKKAA